MWVGGHGLVPAVLAPEKTGYPLRMRLTEPKCRSGRLRIISPPPGFDLSIAQPVASRYTD